MDAKRLRDLMSEVDPSYVLDPESEDSLSKDVDSFLGDVILFSERLARNRHGQGTSVTDADVRFALKELYDIVV